MLNNTREDSPVRLQSACSCSIRAFGLFAGAAAVGLDPFRGVPWLRCWIGKGARTGDTHAMLWSLAAAYACLGAVLKSVYAHQNVGSDAVASVKRIWRKFGEKAEDVVLEPAAMLQIALFASTCLGIVIGIVIGGGTGAPYCIPHVEAVYNIGSFGY